MPGARRAVAMLLVVGVAVGCSTTSPPSPGPGARSPSPLVLVIPTDQLAPAPTPVALPRHEVIAGPDVAGAFDLATDGSAIVWSNGTVDVDAPRLWSFAPATGRTRLVYRSPVAGAILANLAVRHGSYAFAEVTPRVDGSRTWRLVLVDPEGRTHLLDTNDVSADETGVLPMVALADRTVVWATSHAGDSHSLRCELLSASLVDLRPHVLASGPCIRTEFWYPRTDGRQLVYGTVDYGSDGDARHVYLVDGADLAHPRRLDDDGEASLPAIQGTTVVWKAAPRELNMFSPAGLEVLDVGSREPARPLALPSEAPLQLTTPSIGQGYIVGEDASGAEVSGWDLARAAPIPIDRLAAGDPGFISGTRLADRLLAWFYTSSVQGGGTREIRWLVLPAGRP